MQKLNELSGPRQLLALITTMLAVGLPIAGGALWAADQQIDAKYSTDEDLQSVQKVITRQVTEIQVTVEANTKTVAATSQSVDGLTLVVLDLQIDKLEDEIRAMEFSKRDQGAAWNEHEEGALRDKQRSLHDLNIQRERLFARVIASN
jgi:hypothetical protein